jgi:hypothetical protein
MKNIFSLKNIIEKKLNICDTSIALMLCPTIHNKWFSTGIPKTGIPKTGIPKTETPKT